MRRRGLYYALFGWLATAAEVAVGPKDADAVVVDLFVASICPDAAQCETAFLPEVLRQVGSIVDLRLGFVAEVDDEAKWGFQCMHGDEECHGNLLQLCTQAHFPESHDVDGLGRHSWVSFLECVARDEADIPWNTDACLSSLGIPPGVIGRIHACAEGASLEGRRLMQESVDRTIAMCGHHSDGCRSCEMWIAGARACVVDKGTWSNCSVGPDADSWVKAICAAYRGMSRPSVCSIPRHADRPRVVGHSYFSSNPVAAASFAIMYFGAKLVHEDRPQDCDGAMQVTVRLPTFEDWRGGGLQLSFVRNPRKNGGPSYDVSAHLKAMAQLYGSLSDNRRGHQWCQFFDNHLGFYVADSSDLALRLLADGVPFFTGIDSGWYQSIYVEVPGTGSVVEVLGDFVTEPLLPASHVRIASTQQFCTPLRRRRRLRNLSASGLSHKTRFYQLTEQDHHGHHPRHHMDEKDDRDSKGRHYPLDPSADRNKTTWAAADPEAAVQFAVRYLGASEVHQRRGAVADGQCALLKWARWPDGHEWHLVNAFSTDWVTRDKLRPDVPLNISDLAEYIEKDVRDLNGGVYDQFLDHAEVMEVDDLDPLVWLLKADGVGYLVRGLPRDDGRCAIWVDIPRNGIAVQIIGSKFELIREACRKTVWDLCSSV